MGLLSIARSALSSRIVRNSVGDRVLRLFENDEEDTGGILKKIWDLGKSLGNWLIGAVKNFFSFSLTELWGLFTSTVQFLWNFNINQTDADLDASMKARLNALYGITGGALGQLTGQLLCGALPGGTIFYFNPTLGKTVLENVAEEIVDEFAGNVAILARMASRTAMQGYLISKFKNVRNAIKTAATNPAFKSVFETFLGGNYQNIVKNWGEAGQEPWSFAIATENAIESIPNKQLQAFVEEFFEEAIEGCVEIGYVVANSADSYFAQQRAMRSTVLGSPRAVEIVPDRSRPEERLVISGRDELIRPIITTSLITHQTVENRDVGQIVGQPVQEFARAQPSEFTLIIRFSSQPPGRPITQEILKPATYKVPDLKRSSLDWDKIKLAAGGSNGYLWGRFRATANLNNNRQIAVYGGTPEAAQERLRALLELSTAEILTMSVTEELREGRRNTTGALYKPTLQMFPTYCTIINSSAILENDQGRGTLSGNRITRRNRIELYPDIKPFDADQKIQELMTPARNQIT